MSVDNILTTNKKEMFFHEPGGTTIEYVSWVSAKDMSNFVGGYLRCILTGTLTALSICVGESATPSTIAVVLAKDVTSNPDAVGDYVFVEVSAAQIQKAAADAGIADVELFVSVAVTEATVTSDSAILYDSTRKIEKDCLTADSIA